ncbi:winged helix-turn-helix transcriptional regulator [Maledivibacter halophilus]|uniref:Transcriptional regulator, HxlR family n=1 Tax=Maledivibacter halophilus TaxID=36842 RepID=A0A1T5IH23_9FIRM|nr:helix-turn-helix domain-containing protein [Maledivibacter halophilus]SKC38312.1 transcriptional regulator, HxlR family [Maledivibacter halophilus]
MSKIQDKTYQCPLELSIDLIGGKWKSIILWQLREKILRFSQLKRRLPGITQKMLTQQLRELEADGLINRKVYPQVPPKVEYSLTEYGKTVLPILRLMFKWGIKYSNVFDVEVDLSVYENKTVKL